MTSDYCFVPIFYIHGRRYRVRFRQIGRWNWYHHVVDRYDEGDVHKFWLGPFLMVAMIDRDSP